MKNGLITSPDGVKCWYKDDLRHREDGPAIELGNGTKYWYLNDKHHREDGPAVEMINGYKAWYLHGVRHREDGPAQIFRDGSKFWMLTGENHRIDGPAVEYASGLNVWFVHGEELEKPVGFTTMEEWIEYLNDNEEETYQRIHDYKGFIGFIDNPSDKQVRVHQMAHLL